jgi:aspartyl-tRNA(Asn)/glutamyl-tRNA(Gln) amidotransferase subunit B
MLDAKKQGQTYESPSGIMDRLNLRRVSSGNIQLSSTYVIVPDDPILKAITETLQEHPKAVDDYRKGKKGAFNFLIGQIMKKTRGCADPAELNQLLVEELNKKEE